MCVVGSCRIENKKFVFGCRRGSGKFVWLIVKENDFYIIADGSDRAVFLLKENGNK